MTTAPGRAAPFWSRTETTKGSASCAPAAASCSSPESLARDRGTASPLAVKVAGSSPATVARTVFVPGVRPSVSVVEARPSASVGAVVADRVPPPAGDREGDRGPREGVAVLVSHLHDEGLAQSGPGHALLPIA